MPSVTAPARASARQATTGFCAVALTLLLAACAGSQDTAKSLLPPEMVAEAKLRAQADQAACQKAATGDPGPSATGADPLAGRPMPANCTRDPQGAGPLETGAISPGTGTPGRQAGTTAPQPVVSASTPKPNSSATDELYIDFLPSSLTLSDREKASVREAVAARMLSGAVRLQIAAARGGTGNQFDQAVYAEKRARVVNEILPSQMIDSTEFDPTLPEDTVRVVFTRTAKATN